MSFRPDLSHSDWKAKAKREEPMSVTESHALDEALKAQENVQQWVGTLPDSDPNLQWRSRLNERLLAESAASARPSRFGFLSIRKAWVPVLTAGVASLMVLAVLPRLQTQPTVTAGTGAAGEVSVTAESVLLDAHRTTAFSLETGSGDGAMPVAQADDAPVWQWSDADLEAF